MPVTVEAKLRSSLPGADDVADQSDGNQWIAQTQNNSSVNAKYGQPFPMIDFQKLHELALSRHDSRNQGTQELRGFSEAGLVV
jgi:hypothetical protein